MLPKWIQRNIEREKIEKKPPKRIDYWKGALSGIPAFIIGNAPSLDEYDMSVLEDYFTIGINRAFMRLDTTILLWQDFTIWFDHQDEIKELEAIKVCRDICDPVKQFHNFSVKGDKYKFKDNRADMTYGKGNTGPIACQVAVALGCSHLVLLGMDCKKEGKKTNFWGKNKYWGKKTQPHCVRGLEAIREKSPVPIYFCGHNPLFKTTPLDQVLDIFGTEYAHGRKWYTDKLLRKKNE
jgi:hypothetical protein